MKFLINPPQNNVPPFVEKFYNKSTSDAFLISLTTWAGKEFFACIQHYAKKMDLRTWTKLRTLSPAYVLASLPNFITILKSISMQVWERMNGKVIELFSDAYAIWKKRNGTMKSILATA